MDAFEILVVVLASILALCLFVGLIAGILFVLILKQLKHVAEKAAEVADNVEVASEFFRNTTVSGAAVKLFSNAVGYIKKHTHNKD